MIFAMHHLLLIVKMRFKTFHLGEFLQINSVGHSFTVRTEPKELVTQSCRGAERQNPRFCRGFVGDEYFECVNPRNGGE